MMAHVKGLENAATPNHVVTNDICIHFKYDSVNNNVVVSEFSVKFVFLFFVFLVTNSNYAVINALASTSVMDNGSVDNDVVVCKFCVKFPLTFSSSNYNPSLTLSTALVSLSPLIRGCMSFVCIINASWLTVRWHMSCL